MALLIANWMIGFGLMAGMKCKDIPISGKLRTLIYIPFAFPIFTLCVVFWFLGQALWASLTGGKVEDIGDRVHRVGVDPATMRLDGRERGDRPPDVVRVRSDHPPSNFAG